MIDCFTFFRHICESSQNAKLMARIALNAMFGPKDYPVNLEELRFLSPTNRAVVNGFITWVVYQRKINGPGCLANEEQARSFRDIANELI